MIKFILGPPHRSAYYTNILVPKYRHHSHSIELGRGHMNISSEALLCFKYL